MREQKVSCSYSLLSNNANNTIAWQNNNNNDNVIFNIFVLHRSLLMIGKNQEISQFQ